MPGVRRAAALWLVLFAAYAATLGLPAFGASDYGGDEPHYLLTAESIVSDADIDLRDEYATRAYRDWYPYPLERHGRLTNGQANEPHAVGFALLIAPAYALGGPLAVELFMAAIAALAFVIAALLARRIVPEPWATGAVLACGLSPPALAYGTAVYPAMPAGAALTAAALVALRARVRPRIRWVFASSLLLATLPWLGIRFVIPGAVIALAMMHWLRSRGRGFAMLVVLETLLFSAVLYVTVNDRLFGGFTPHSAEVAGRSPTGADDPADYVDRAHRLVALWLDRTYGALRWAPVIALAFFALWLLWRSRRDHVAHMVPERGDAEAAASLCALVCAAQVFVAAFLTPTMFGFYFPGRDLIAALPLAAALCAWGLRHAPRTGTALATVTVLTSVWLYVELRIDGGGLIGPSSRAPLGPLDVVLPLFATDSAWAGAVLAGAVTTVAVLLWREWRAWREAPGAYPSG